MKKIQISEEKLNQLASEISQRLFQSHYFGQGAIGGESLKNFCDYEQINKFLLFQVYQVWQLQVSRFKHPYFNFEQSEIHQLLKKLQNLLSRNIEIKQEDFKPLLQKAVYNNLKLLSSPKEALENFFFQNREKISIELYQRYTPFFADFNFVINSIHRYHEKHELNEVKKEVFLQKMDRVMEVYEQKSQQDVDTYRSLRFYKLTNRHLEEVVEEDAREQKQREAQRKQEEEARLREEAQKKTQEALRKEAEEQAQEEETRKAELSFFDDLEKPKQDLIDLDKEEAKKAKTAEEQKDTILSKINKDPQENQKSTQADRLKEAAQEMQKDSILSKINSDKAADEKAAEKEQDSPPPPFPRRQEQSRSTAPQAPRPPKTEKSSTTAEESTAKPKANSPNSLVDLLKARREAAIKADQEKDKEERPKEPAAKKEADKPEAREPKPQPPHTQQTAEPVRRKDPPSQKQEDEKKDEPQKGSLLSKFKKRTESLGDRAREDSDQKPTLAERFRKENGNEPKEKGKESELASPAGEQIKPDEIPIHLQYRYVQKVFGGNNVRFRIIVDKVNNANSPDEIEKILEKYVFSNPQLKRDDELVQDFAALMRRRF